MTAATVTAATATAATAPPATAGVLLLSKREAVAERAMVATKHELATAAATAQLRAGGNVMDAAVAAAFAVGVVEPASSGIGGGGYLVYQMGARGGAFGFPMRAPGAATPDMYRLTGDPAVGMFGWPGVEGDANLEGARSIAVPGAVAGLCAAHRELGRLELAEVMEPAIELAAGGFAPGWFDVLAIGKEAGKLARHPDLAATFMPGGAVKGGVEIPAPGGAPGEEPFAAAAQLRQPHLADTLRAIASKGAAGFYHGDAASQLVDGVREQGGVLSAEDLATYRPYHWHEGAAAAPVEVGYRDCTVRVAPFASGGMTTAMTLQLLDRLGPAATGDDAERWHRFIGCARLAWADRFAFFADPELVDVPWRGLVAAEYATARAGALRGKAPGRYANGDPWPTEGRAAPERLPGSAPAFPTGTTHLAVVDGDGNAVSLTNTLMSAFGSGVVAGQTGVVLNNGMMWFDPVPGHVNSIAPGKLPLNNMSPVLLLRPRQDQSTAAFAAVGASGGRRISNCVSAIVTALIDGELGPQAAIDAPRVDCSTPLTAVDARLDDGVIEELRYRRHRLAVIDERYACYGMGPFASPVAVTREADGTLRGGADTFHSAHAAGL